MNRNDISYYSQDSKIKTKRQVKQDCWIERLKVYWSYTKEPVFNTRVGEIYEVDFGENVGSEFSGLHLAICLKNTKPTENRMLVVPLSSKYKEFNLEHVIKVPSKVPNQTIEAGVVLGEAQLVSKHRVRRISTILREAEYGDDGIMSVGYYEIPVRDLELFKRIDF